MFARGQEEDKGTIVRAYLERPSMHGIQWVFGVSRLYVSSKKYRIWVWVVMRRRTRQVVSWMWGDRSVYTCAMLWSKVPENCKHAFCYSDFLEAYQKVLDKNQHQACAKQPDFCQSGSQKSWEREEELRHPEPAKEPAFLPSLLTRNDCLKAR
ncbi:MAG: IS1 family transposase [Cytophagaceae bacterium]|nr:MAG: IS1 family transposase [Cytophagaceae bacterium]